MVRSGKPGCLPGKSWSDRLLTGYGRTRGPTAVGREAAVRAREAGTPLRIALLGCGVVGSQVARLLHEQAADLAARAGGPLEIAGVAVRRPELARITGVDPSLLTRDAVGLVTRPDVDLVVELIGGLEPARSPLPAAPDSGPSAGTADQALLGHAGGAPRQAAEADRADPY